MTLKLAGAQNHVVLIIQMGQRVGRNKSPSSAKQFGASEILTSDFCGRQTVSHVITVYEKNSASSLCHNFVPTGKISHEIAQHLRFTQRF